jgi:uncharacterized protein (TIGR00369 family)
VPVLEIDAAGLQDLLTRVEAPYTVDHVGDDGVRLRLPLANSHIRPGGTVSGPALMALADGTAWATILSIIGPVLSVVSTSLHIDFLRRPEAADVVAEGHLLRLGTTLAVVDVALRSSKDQDLVAKAQVTYSIPRAEPPAH